MPRGALFNLIGDGSNRVPIAGSTMREIQTPVAEPPWLAEFGNSL